MIFIGPILLFALLYLSPTQTRKVTFIFGSCSEGAVKKLPIFSAHSFVGNLLSWPCFTFRGLPVQVTKSCVMQLRCSAQSFHCGFPASILKGKKDPRIGEILFLLRHRRIGILGVFLSHRVLRCGAQIQNHKPRK